MKVLWLASWYPNKLNPFDGDFIQRHAQAAALYNEVYVIFATPDQEGKVTNEINHSFTERKGLTEHIIYFKKSATLIGRIIAYLKWEKLLKNAVKKYVDRSGRPDIVHVHVPLKAGIIARWIKRTMGIPFIVTEHSAHYGMKSPGEFSQRSAFYRKNVAKIFKEAILVTNVSAVLGETIRKLFGLKDVCVIPNVVDTDLFYHIGADHQKFRFIHVSTFTEPQKNIEGILNAIQHLAKSRQDFELVMVGPPSPAARKQIEVSGLGKIVMLAGEIFYGEVAKQMQQASAFVLFSRYENLPCVIIEALCCGLPVITSDVGGVKESVNSNNGMLLQSGNEANLVECMNRMIDEYKNFDRARIAKEAREKYNYSAIGKEFDELYKRALKVN